MIKKIIQTTVVCSFLFGGNVWSYSMQNLFDEYFMMPQMRTFDDFRDQAKAREILQLHNIWNFERDFLIYNPLPDQIPLAVGTTGVLYDSGINFNTYQNRLNRSFELTRSINKELQEALGYACKICLKKQAIKIPCPSVCAEKM